MNNLGFNPVYKPKDQSRRYKGLAVVAGVHVLLLWGIISGTAQDALRATKKSLEAVVIQEVIIPPPPPPPPPEKPREILKTPDAPPPPFVPPPEIEAPPTVAPVIESAPVPPPAPPVIAPPPPPAPPAPVARPDIRIACPTQVAPEMPRKAIQEGAEGVVKAEVTIRDGVVREVQVLSGPRVFHSAVRSAMMQYKCQAGAGEVKATQEFVFKLE
jgi:periplasmic protein TonB